jgi:uncharacterized protein (DUF427 family)
VGGGALQPTERRTGHADLGEMRWFDVVGVSMGRTSASSCHAADPYHRIDIRRSSRHLVVSDGDTVVADTRSPLVLYESGFAPRWYVSRADIEQDALREAGGQTFCPYKGLASYYDVGEAPVRGQDVVAHGPDRNLSVDEQTTRA